MSQQSGAGIDSRKKESSHMNASVRLWVSPTAEALPLIVKRLWQRVSNAGLPAVAISLLAVIFPTHLGQHFVIVAAFGSTLLLCFPQEPLLSLAGAREPGWWNIQVAHND